MPYDDDDDDRMSWTSTGTASSWIRSHKPSIHLSPKYADRHYIPHLSPLYRATFKSTTKRARRLNDTASSGNVSPDDWYYYSDSSSRNLSPLTYSPHIAKDADDTTADYHSEDSDLEFEPFPWVRFDDDDDDNIMTEPLFIDITDKSRTPSDSRPGLLIPYNPPDDSHQTEKEVTGNDSRICSHPDQQHGDNITVDVKKQPPASTSTKSTTDIDLKGTGNIPTDSLTNPSYEPPTSTLSEGASTTAKTDSDRVKNTSPGRWSDLPRQTPTNTSTEGTTPPASLSEPPNNLPTQVSSRGDFVPPFSNNVAFTPPNACSDPSSQLPGNTSTGLPMETSHAPVISTPTDSGLNSPNQSPANTSTGLPLETGHVPVGSTPKDTDSNSLSQLPGNTSTGLPLETGHIPVTSSPTDAGSNSPNQIPANTSTRLSLRTGPAPVAGTLTDPFPNSVSLPPTNPIVANDDTRTSNEQTVDTGNPTTSNNTGILPTRSPLDIPVKSGYDDRWRDEESSGSGSTDVIPKSDISLSDKKRVHTSNEGTNTDVFNEEQPQSGRLVNEVSRPAQAIATLEQRISSKKSKTTSRPGNPTKRLRYAKTIFLTTLVLALTLALMMYFPACCDKAEYYFGIPGLRVDHRSIPPH